MKASNPADEDDRLKTLILPIGDSVGRDILEIIAANIQAHLDMPAEILPDVPLPPHAFDLKRNQINALTLLKDLRERNFPPKARILAVTSTDLFIPIFTFVFGEAQLEEPFAVISLCRIRRNTDGSPAALSVFYERSAKIAVHEVAHTFNMNHCQDPDCLMKYMPDLDAIDGQELIFCPYCSRDLKSRIESG